ncbi:hypothetical protein CR513_18117, partial [Mucuna pruriens]
MVLPPSKEVVTPFVIYDLGIQEGEYLRRIRHAWKNVLQVLATTQNRTHLPNIQRSLVRSYGRTTQTNATVMTLANQSVVKYDQAGYAVGPPPRNARDPPYGMPYGWNTENPVNEEQEQQNVVNDNKVGPMDIGAQHNASWNATPFVIHRRAPQSKEKWKSLEERLRAIEGGDKYGLDAVDLCLVPNMGLSADFKILEFDKYKGSSCPRVHLAMYCRKMATYIYDDKVLIHYFQDNLIGAALSWYISLERGRIKTWRDITEAFLK